MLEEYKHDVLLETIFGNQRNFNV